MHPLKIYCLKNKISQKCLSKKLNRSENWISFIVSYKKTPSPKLAKKISELTGIPILDLLYPNENFKNRQKTEIGA
jgi:ribosome-binding protein aMBF1 (putative translation factor)